MKAHHLVFVLYDSIKNSIFNGQVLTPIITQLEQNPLLQATLISFEKNCAVNISAIKHSRLSIRIIKKIPFLGSITLAHDAYHLKKIVHMLPFFECIARGPIAGLLCKKVLSFPQCTKLTIQARGLLAAEYAYTHQSEKNLIKKIIHAFRTYQFNTLESAAYTNSDATISCTIQAVSPALKTYIITMFKIPEISITIANMDIPTFISSEQLKEWKQTIRQELGIAYDALVFCYNGSIKPWQCPQETIEYFITQWQNNPKAFLLILSQDNYAFETLLQQTVLPRHCYIILRVAHTHIYRYLAACDIGLLLRHDHIINWVSRPTKALEYQAAGLQIVHNNTVQWLIDTRFDETVK